MGNEKGIIYVACGKKYVAEAIASVRSVRACMPQISVTLFTDQDDVATGRDGFDGVERLTGSKRSFCDKILPMLRSPYDKTLFLDTDTYMCQSCDDAFTPLDTHDIAVAHDPYRSDFAFETLPACYPTLNTGVIAFRKSCRVTKFIEDWATLHETKYARLHPTDQPAFRELAYRSDIRLHILPPEFNLRTWYPCFIGGHAKVKIIHDRNRYAPLIARTINARMGPRIFGACSPALLACYYYTKANNVLRRWVRTAAAHRFRPTASARRSDSAVAHAPGETIVGAPGR